jgi:hypothetical protein
MPSVPCPGLCRPVAADAAGNVSLDGMDAGGMLDALGGLPAGGAGTAAARAPPAGGPGAAALPSDVEMAEAAAAEAAAGGKGKAAAKGGQAAALAALSELWDEGQYRSEFGMESFLAKLDAGGAARPGAAEVPGAEETGPGQAPGNADG